MTPPDVRTIDLDALTVDTRLQPREHLSTDAIADYRDAMAEGWDGYRDGDAITAFQIDGKLLLASGFHRVQAAKESGLSEIRVQIMRGDMDDAILWAAKTNTSHGVRRTNEDKRRSVTMALGTAWGKKASSNEVAKHVGVGHTLVDNIRRSLASDASENHSPAREYTTRHGTRAVMDTGKIGKKPVPPPPPRPAPKQAEQRMRDQLGEIVPKFLEPVFADKSLENIALALERWRDGVREVAEQPASARLHYPDIRNAVKSLASDLRSLAPYCVCRWCEGRCETCKACHQTGWMTKREYDMTPQERKAK